MVAAPLTGVILVLCFAAAAGCGSAVHTHGKAHTASRAAVPVANRVCGVERRAAATELNNQASLQIADSDPANIECVVRGSGISVDTVAMATADAWTEFDTEQSHFAQVFGNGGAHNSLEQPHPVPGMSGNVEWVPAQSLLFATNGTQSSGGTYITVTVSRQTNRGPTSMAVARAVARATLASAPRGPAPGAPPN